MKRKSTQREYNKAIKALKECMVSNKPKLKAVSEKQARFEAFKEIRNKIKDLLESDPIDLHDLLSSYNYALDMRDALEDFYTTKSEWLNNVVAQFNEGMSGDEDTYITMRTRDYIDAGVKESVDLLYSMLLVAPRVLATRSKFKINEATMLSIAEGVKKPLAYIAGADKNVASDFMMQLELQSCLYAPNPFDSRRFVAGVDKTTDHITICPEADLSAAISARHTEDMRVGCPFAGVFTSYIHNAFVEYVTPLFDELEDPRVMKRYMEMYDDWEEGKK